MRRSGVFAAAIVCAATVGIHAQNWPQFRGAASGVSADEPSLPDTWNDTENVVWKMDIPGRAWSSPVVWGDHVFVTTAINTKLPNEPLKPVPTYTARSVGGSMTGADIARTSDEHRWALYDVDFRTGKIRWEATVHTGVPTQGTHQKNSFASETPVTDGERVYAYFGNVGLFAFDMKGTLLWSHRMGPFKMLTGWGAAASPAVHDGRVYVVNDNEEQSFIAAFDGRTGNEIWRRTRPERSTWATPFVWVNQLRTEIVTAGAVAVRSYDLDGKLLWQLSSMSAYAIPTPFANDGLLYVTSGYPSDARRPVYAIRPGASGDISLEAGETSNAYIAWSHPTLGPYNPSPLVYRGCYYTLLDRGIMSCHDARTGKEIFPRHRISVEASSFTSSLWAYNGRVFALSEDGDTFVLEAGPEFKLIRKNPLNEMTLATPAVANGSLIVRTASKLYRIAANAK